MRNSCTVCGKEIEPFAEYWLREPDEFNGQGVVIKQSKLLPFCGFGCIFGYAGAKLRKLRQDLKRVEDSNNHQAAEGIVRKKE